jgi:Uma2 family endonuclease
MRQVTDYEPVTYEEYLRIEEANRDVRHEYVHGFLYAMVGASRRHHEIIQNIVLALMRGRRRGPCRVASETVKLRVSTEVIYYPDVVVTCDPSDDDPLVVERPSLVIEVLSPGTGSTDLREKRVAYRGMPSLLAYFIIYQDEQRVERHWRDRVDNQWQVQLLVEGSLTIPGLATEVRIDDIYRDLLPAE